jgi:protein phosphatase 2C family protein 2/3
MTDSSGTTVNAAMITDKEVVCANAGDTRCVVSCEKKAKDISQDHKPNRLDEIER